MGSSILGGGPKIPPFITDYVLTTSGAVCLFVLHMKRGKINICKTKSRQKARQVILHLFLFLSFVLIFCLGVKACSYLDQEVAPMETLGEAGSNDKVPQGPPGVPQGGPQKGAPPGKSKNGEKWAKFFTNPE